MRCYFILQLQNIYDIFAATSRAQFIVNNV